MHNARRRRARPIAILEKRFIDRSPQHSCADVDMRVPVTDISVVPILNSEDGRE